MIGTNSESSGQKELLAPERLLEKYASLLDRSRRMLDCARQGLWEDLLNEEARYVEEVQRLGFLEPSCELDQAEAQSRLELMEQILECNLEVKRQLQSRRDEIGELINLSRRQGELGRSYGIIDSIDES